MINSFDASWCVFGDFNDVRDVEERRKQLNMTGTREFNEFIRRTIPLISHWMVTIFVSE